MRIHPLSTGTVRVTGRWSGPPPIDTGETANVNNVPFARFDVARKDELRGADPTVHLPSHDPESVARFQARTTRER
jgi:hypothetical protein